MLILAQVEYFLFSNSKKHLIVTPKKKKSHRNPNQRLKIVRWDKKKKLLATKLFTRECQFHCRDLRSNCVTVRFFFSVTKYEDNNIVLII